MISMVTWPAGCWPWWHDVIDAQSPTHYLWRNQQIQRQYSKAMGAAFMQKLYVIVMVVSNESEYKTVEINFHGTSIFYLLLLYNFVVYCIDYAGKTTNTSYCSLISIFLRQRHYTDWRLPPFSRGVHNSCIQAAAESLTYFLSAFLNSYVVRVKFDCGVFR